MKALLGMAMAVGLIATAGAAPTVVPPAQSGLSIIQVEGGCGRDFHRGPRGGCQPNWREWEPGWRACPPGWHLGGQGRRCWPN